MKKAISLLLAFVMLFTALSASVTGLAAQKKFVKDVIAQIQKTDGFIPNETAAVVGNCYGFVSAVCERLYGVKYQEGLNGDGYTCAHKTGYYYTVKTYVTQNSDTSECVEDIISFFVNNAYPGDIVHYSSLSGSSHTFMIQSIDNEKMQIFHSNYQTRSLPSSACHTDTIYWSSFRSNPTSTVYNSDGTLYSHNSMFYNKQKRGGLGITINRFTDYEKKFYVSYIPPVLKCYRSSTTSVMLTWNAVSGASKYQIQYKRKKDKKYKVLNSSCTDTFYDVKNLQVGKKYNFRVTASVNGKWGDYSNVLTKKVMPPTISATGFSPETNGLRVAWGTRTDITGVIVYRSKKPNGKFKKVKTVKAPKNYYIDKKAKYGVKYYYKLRRYIKVGAKKYYTTSKAFSGAYKLQTPVITYKRVNLNTITFEFSGDTCKLSYDYYFVSDSNKNATAVVNTTQSSITLESLKAGEIYTVFARENTPVGKGAYGSIRVRAVPVAVSNLTAKADAGGITVSFDKCNDAAGYFVYRTSDGIKYDYVTKLEGKNSTSYTDTSIKYNTKYKYRINPYAHDAKGGEVWGQPAFTEDYVTSTLSAPADFKAVRTSPSRITLSWDEVEYAEKYDIQYKVKGGKWKIIRGVTGTSTLIKKLTLGKEYHFRIRSVSKIGKSSFTRHISKKVLPPTPDAPTLKCVKRGIRVIYKPKKYASSYYIFRANKEDGKYKFVGKVEGHKKKSYTDSTVKKGKTYYYKIALCVTKNGVNHKSSKSPSASQKFE